MQNYQEPPMPGGTYQYSGVGRYTTPSGITYYHGPLWSTNGKNGMGGVQYPSDAGPKGAQEVLNDFATRPESKNYNAVHAVQLPYKFSDPVQGGGTELNQWDSLLPVNTPPGYSKKAVASKMVK